MTAGSWYWSGPDPEAPAKANTLYVLMDKGRDPATSQIEAVTREFGIHGWTRGSALDGIVIDALRIVQVGLRAITLESEDHAGCCGSLDTGPGTGMKGVVIRNSTVARTGTGQFDDGSYGNAISIINATAPVVEGNTVSYSGNHGNGIQVQNANGARVSGNTVEHWNHNGIDVKGSRDVIVRDNLARDQTHTGAGFYTENSADVIFAHNRVERVSNGFQISEGASASVLDNKLSEAETGIYFGPKAKKLTVEKNVARTTHIAIQGDGSGNLTQLHNDWGTDAIVMTPTPQ
jgi:parallel beta-helix repeat protein